MLVTIFYLALWPDPLGDEPVELFPGADKAVHAVMFGTLALIIPFDFWLASRPLGARGIIMAGAGAALLGGAVEIVQQAMGMGRGADVLDFVADSAGAAMAVYVCLCVARKKSRAG